MSLPKPALLSLLLLLFFYQPTLSSTRRTVRDLHQARRSARAARINCKQEIETDQCKTAVRKGIDSSDCISRCVSPQCHTKIYATEPLEEGEVDPVRARLFTRCVHQQHAMKRTQVNNLE